MIVMGHRTRGRVMGQLSYTCTKCQQKTYHTLVRNRRFFTVFWIPVIPMAKFTTTRCNVCGYQTYFDNKKADEYFPSAKDDKNKAPGQPPQQA